MSEQKSLAIGEPRPLTIVALDVQNVQRVRAVHIVPKGSTVILAGQNAQGKTSILDAIEMALGGGKSISERPIRDGANRAQIVVDLGEMVVERTISKGGSTLVVRDADGHVQRSPQTILNDLCNRISFDPLAFSRMDPAKQNELLRDLVGLDFDELEKQREGLYNTRTKTARDAKAARATSEGTLVPGSTPTEPVDVSQLMAQLRDVHTARAAASEHARKVTESERELRAAEAGVESAKLALKQSEQRLMRAKLQRGELTSSAPPAPVDPAELERQITDAQAINRNVDKRKRRDELELEANHLDQQVEELTGMIDDIDRKKQELLAGAKYPVAGLALGETGPLFKGVPLGQASGAERLRVSVGIGLALNPRLRVLLIRDASLLDEQSLGLVASMAAEAGAQVWLERVGTGDPTAVIISDGQVLGGTVEAEERAS